MTPPARPPRGHRGTSGWDRTAMGRGRRRLGRSRSDRAPGRGRRDRPRGLRRRTHRPAPTAARAGPPRPAPPRGPDGGRGSRAGAWHRHCAGRSGRSPRMAAPSVSCRTKASRSAGLSASRTISKRQADRVGQERLLLRGRTVRIRDDRVGHDGLERVLAPSRSGPKPVQAETGHDRGQPGTEVVDLAGVGPARPEPGVLDDVVGLCQRAEQSIGGRAQARAIRFEALGQGVVAGPGRGAHRSVTLLQVDPSLIRRTRGTLRDRLTPDRGFR